MADSESESILPSQNNSYGSVSNRSVGDFSNSRSFTSSNRRFSLLPAVIVLFTVLLERIAFYSLTANLYLFLNQNLYGWESYNAMRALLVFTGVAYTSSIFGGWLADSVLGRFKTIAFSLFLFMGTYWFLPFSSTTYYRNPIFSVCLHQVPSVNDSSNSSESSHVEVIPMYKERCSSVLLTLIILAALGTGAIKANIAPFGAEQVHHINSNNLRIYLNWFYWCVNIGAFIAILIIAYIQQTSGFFYGYIYPASCLAFAFTLFVASYPLYASQPPPGSALTKVCSIIKEAWKSNKRFKMRQKENEDNSNTAGLEWSINNPSWLDMAKVRYGGKFHEAAVEDVRSLGTIFLVFVFLIPFWVLYFQMHTTFLAQGLHLRLKFEDNNDDCHEEHNGFYIPAAWLTLFDIIFLIIFIPLMDRVIYPYLDKQGWKIPLLCRIIIGMCFASLSMIAAGVLETFRLDSARQKTICQVIEDTPFYAANISILWQIPQYALMGISEVFASVAGMEFACSQAPSSIQGAVMGLFYFCAGMGSLLGSLLLLAFEKIDGSVFKKHHAIKNVNYGQLNYYFFFLSGLQFLTLVAFSFMSRRLKVRKLPLSVPSRLGSRWTSSNESNSRRNFMRT